MADRSPCDVVIVGAGIAGLMAARRLVTSGARVVLVDKGRGVGGRLATRRIGSGRADHGAQFFTARSEAFQRLVDEWLSLGLIFEWSRGWSDGSLVADPPDGFPRYAATEGFAHLAKYLAQGLDVRLDRRVETVALVNERWVITLSDAEVVSGHAVILTAPVPQSLGLLNKASDFLTRDEIDALSRVDYAPCLAGLFVVEAPLSLPEPGALQRPDHPIAWIADNRRKGISPSANVLTVHAGPEASRERWQQPEEVVLDWMAAEAGPWLAESLVTERRLKRWRYALPTTLYPEQCFQSVQSGTLLMAGDAFAGPRVEGAVLSGGAAADAVLGRL